MKILFDHHEAFMLAHGGLQIQIERTAEALRGHGLDVEWQRWWDEGQKGDIIHFFGRPNPSQIAFAQAKGIRYVMQELLTSQGSRSKMHLRLQGYANAILRKVLPGNYRLPLRWDSYQKADAVIAITPWEAWIMRTLFRPPIERLHVIPNGVDDTFFNSRDAIHATLPRQNFLVTVATITERKRMLELAEAAILGKIPLIVIGKPYDDNESYYQRFLEVVKSSGGLVKYLGAIEDRRELAKIYQDARGFVLPSTMETQSLAALEAAATGRPLLLSDLPWARQTFGDTATYISLSNSYYLANQLKTFYQLAPGLPASKCPARWSEVAGRLLRIYEAVLGN